MTRDFQVCTRCVMDTTDPEIQFDAQGVCNHCKNYSKKKREMILPQEEREAKLVSLVKRIQEAGRTDEYDCVLGISGGVDSTFMAFEAKQLGLRPLAVHLDNGWNSRLAVTNIEKVLNRLDVDLYTHVVDWEEFKDLQLAYLRASVVDIEVASDHAIGAIIHKVASETRVKYILSGSNFATEGIMPRSWIWTKNDLTNLKDIHNRFGTRKLKTYPTLGLRKLILQKKVFGYETVPLLNYLEYNRDEAKKILMKDFGWEDYGGKHFESVFTKFYQGYILPFKFSIDKRRAHLSTQICSGHITREEALKILDDPPYDQAELKRDMEYVLKKFGLTQNEWNELMALPIKQHDDYRTDARWRSLLGVS